MSASSRALEPTPNLRFVDPLSPLDLCTFACIWREESALTRTARFCTILVQISPLESALTDTPPVTPLDSALTNTPGGGGGSCFDLHESVAALPLFRLSTFDCQLWQIVSLFLVFGPFSISFRINTCISVASKQLYPYLESTLMKKPGDGEGVCLPKTKPCLFRSEPSDGKGGLTKPPATVRGRYVRQIHRLRTGAACCATTRPKMTLPNPCQLWADWSSAVEIAFSS
jgi:hypothetical protein